jgi:hypothetical protein
MKTLYTALAVALAVSSVGCQGLGPRGMRGAGCGDCCEPCHLTQSRMAPRPLLGRNACPVPGALDYPAAEGCGPGQGLCGCYSDPAGNSCVNGAVGGVLDCPCTANDQYYNFNQGPPTGQVAYPYYTTRGPRDFLLKNPPSIGPY